MIGTELVGADPLADLEPVELGQHEVEHDEVDRLRREAGQRLLAVPGLDDPVPLVLERVREELLDRVLVVDEQDGRGVGHRGPGVGRSVAGRPYYSQPMAVVPPRPRRRRPRRGSLERPVNGRLYRGTWLLVSLPLLLAAFTVARPVALPAPSLPPAFDARAALELAQELSTDYPDRVARDPRAPTQAARLVQGAARAVRAHDRGRALPRHDPGARDARVPEPRHDRARPVAGGDRRRGAPRQPRGRRGRERQRLGDRGADRARPLVRAGAALEPVGAGTRAAHPHARLPLDRRRRLRRDRRRRVRDGVPVPARRVRADRPRRDRGPRAAAPPDRGEHGPLARADSLVQTASARIAEQAGPAARAPRPPGNSSSTLAFPYTLYEQAPVLARGIPAVTITTAGDRAAGDPRRHAATA